MLEGFQKKWLQKVFQPITTLDALQWLIKENASINAMDHLQVSQDHYFLHWKVRIKAFEDLSIHLSSILFQSKLFVLGLSSIINLLHKICGYQGIYEAKVAYKGLHTENCLFSLCSYSAKHFSVSVKEIKKNYQNFLQDMFSNKFSRCMSCWYKTENTGQKV